MAVVNPIPEKEPPNDNSMLCEPVSVSASLKSVPGK